MTTDTSHRDRSGVPVEGRVTTGAAGSSAGFGAAGVVAGILALSGTYPALLGVMATGMGLVTLIAALGTWKRAQDRHGEASGTTGTNLSIGGALAAVTAIILGLATVATTGQGVGSLEDVADTVEQEADRVGTALPTDA